MGRFNYLNDAPAVGTCFFNAKSGSLNGHGRFPIQMTRMLQSKPGRMQPIGQALGDGIEAAHVFQEEETAIHPQHPFNFRQRRHRIGNGAKHQRADDRIELVIGEGELLASAAPMWMG